MTATTNFAPVSIDSQPLAVEGLSVGSYGNYDHSYFMKDCGSTRMVLDQNGTIKQALMYQHCRTIAPVAGIPRTGSDPLRDKFTSKEFDEDGDANWAPGIKAYHFKVQMYDSDFELGRQMIIKMIFGQSENHRKRSTFGRCGKMGKKLFLVFCLLICNCEEANSGWTLE